MKKNVFLILVTFLLVGCNFTESVKENSAMSLAKEFCTCLFVVQQSEDVCRKANQEAFIFGSAVVDYENKQIATKGLGYESMAKFTSKHYGCTVKSWPSS